MLCDFIDFVVDMTESSSKLWAFALVCHAIPALVCHAIPDTSVQSNRRMNFIK